MGLVHSREGVGLGVTLLSPGSGQCEVPGGAVAHAEVGASVE